MKKLVFVFISLFLICPVFAEEPPLNNTGDINSVFREQQKQINDILINYTNDDIDLMNKMRKGYNVNVRLENVEFKMNELKMKKNDLKMKVFEYNKGIPDWWEAAEKAFKEKQEQLYRVRMD